MGYASEQHAVNSETAAQAYEQVADFAQAMLRTERAKDKPDQVRIDIFDEVRRTALTDAAEYHDDAEEERMALHAEKVTGLA